MRSKGQIIFGLVILLIGVSLLIDNLFHISIWSFFWPLTIIALGVWMLLRPRSLAPGAKVRQRLLGDIRRKGEWQVANEDFWVLIGAIKLDMTEAQIPDGETLIRTYGFIGDIKLVLPEGIGISASCTSFVTDAKAFGQKTNNIMSPFEFVSDDYVAAERKVRLECTHFIADLKLRRT